MRRARKHYRSDRTAKVQVHLQEKLDLLQVTLGYTFKDLNLLRTALTHQSFLEGSDEEGESYQRLEFLGDRVLGLVVSTMLFELKPQIVVGRLARRLSDLVRAETCADVAEVWDLSLHIRFGVNIGQDAKQSRSILADVCEAVLGAVNLDGGFEASARLVQKFWAPFLNESGVALQDAKTALQEWVQARGLQPPKYSDLERTGPDHDPIFKVRVEIPGFDSIEAQASAKKIAQQSAAEAFLMREGVWLTGSRFTRKDY